MSSPDEIELAQARSMFQQRMQANVMQNRQQIKRLWAKFDAEGDGYLEIDEFKAALEYLGAPMDRDVALKFMRKFSKRKGIITYEDFFCNLIGLDRDFFSNKKAMKSMAGRQTQPMKQPQQLQKLLPAGTPLEAVDKLFRTKLRKALFNINHCMFVVLKRPSAAVKTLDRNGLFNVFNSLGIMCTQLELDQIMTYFDNRSNGKLDYMELACEMLRLPRPGHALPKRSRPPLAGRVASLVECLRLNCERAAAGPVALINLFKKFDQDGSGTIAYDEMCHMVREFGCNVEGQDVAMLLLDRYAGSTGMMSYVAFLTRVLGLRPDALRDPDQPDRLSTPELQQHVAGNFKGILFSNKEAIQKAFAAFDRDGSGELSFKEFMEGIQALELPISVKQARRMFREYDDDNSGMVTIVELSEQLLKVPTQAPLPTARLGSKAASRAGKHDHWMLTTASLEGAIQPRGDLSGRDPPSTASSRYTYDSVDAAHAATLTPSQLRRSLAKIYEAASTEPPSSAPYQTRSTLRMLDSHRTHGSGMSQFSVDDMLQSARSAPLALNPKPSASRTPLLSSRPASCAAQLKTHTQMSSERRLTSRRHTFNPPPVLRPIPNKRSAKQNKPNVAHHTYPEPVARTHHPHGLGTVDLKPVGAFGGAGKGTQKGWVGGADRTCNQYLAQPHTNF